MVNATNPSDDVPTWDIVSAFFNQSGGGDCSHALVRHQIESYNEFLDKKLIQIIQGFNPITVCHNYDTAVNDFRYKIYLNALQPSITKPMHIASDGTQTIMTPFMARMNNLTYAANIYVDIHVITEALNADGVVERNEQQLPNVCIGKIPIMVRSKACTLSQIPEVAYAKDNHECRYDLGGYFIINGNEKVVISQDRISENQTLVFHPNGNTDGLYAEIRSMPDGVFLPPKTTNLHMSGKPNHMGRVIRMSASFLRTDVPVFVMFRALGVESDRDILMHIMFDVVDPKNERMLQELAACADDAADVHTQADAIQVLLKILGTTGTPREYLEQPGRAVQILKNTIRNDFLAHVGPSFQRKALYLGYMVRKLLRIHLGYQPYDNRDNYLHKRIDTPGILFSTLFRQCYGKLIKDVRNQVVRELNTWRAQPNTPLNLITPSNVHCFFRTSVIDTGLRYALSTGNWGVKSIGSFQNIRQGVAQVLNRLSYLSTLSHLRRINTPMEKNGKLVQPRKLENTQFGMICPSECYDPNTPVLLWNGKVVKAEEIEVGDYLIDDNGNPVKVKSTCSGYKTMYDIIPLKKNFMSYTVTDNHILTLKVRKYKGVRNHLGKKELMWFDKSELRYMYKDFDNEEDLRKLEASLDNDDVIDITIEKYLSLPKNVQKHLYTFKSSGIHWEHKDVALDPYILGLWLGDGLSSGYGFATADKELLNKWGGRNDATVSKGLEYTTINKTEKAPLKKLLEKYALIKNKHIPLDYLVNDRKTRLAVLAGLVDTDGSVRANGHEIRISQGESNYQIIYDAEFLARSLGFCCHVNEGMRSYIVNGEKRFKPYKELTITGQYLYEIPTVLLRKKLNRFDNPVFEKRCSSFMQSPFKLVKKDVQEFVGWQVEGTGRFLLGDMSVAHNTPEGASVGLVKNMAMSTHITTNISSAYVRELAEKCGTNIMDERQATKEDVRAFLEGMGKPDAVHVMINGDVIGFHTDPTSFYKQIKHFKRCGIIAPTTSVVWDVCHNMIRISTEAGRMCRPLHIVDTDTRELRLTRLMQAKGMSWSAFSDRKYFQHFLAPMSDVEEEGFIEYMDVDEIDKAMVAMNAGDLAKSSKGTSLPPLFTNCEIHPSLINGVLAANIPFMDHNQSPRNCYQCLWLEEPVQMANGELKRIKDVVVGDSVVCFDPKTMLPYNTRVVHQYVRPPQKPVYRVRTLSGRHIIATQDHKFRTAAGWVEPFYFDAHTKLGICYQQKAVPHDVMTGEVLDLTQNLPHATQKVLEEMGLLPLQHRHPNLPILARLCGYYAGAAQHLCFKTYTDEHQYEEDVKILGFAHGARDATFLRLLNAMTSQGHDWLMGASKLVCREYLSGFQGGCDIPVFAKPDLVPLLDLVCPGIAEEKQLMDWIGMRYDHQRCNELAVRCEYINHVVFCKSMNRQAMSLESWKEAVTVQAGVMFVPFFAKDVTRQVMISDITVESDHHSFFGGDGFAVSNSAMGKQAVGIYMSNFNQRIDTMAHVLHYPQKRIVRTKLSKYTHSDDIPSGINAIVAIMTHTGYNQEDSVMINGSAIDRGLFTSTYFKSYRDQCNKNHSTGEEEVFKKVQPDGSSGAVRPFNYDKLGEDGFVPKNTQVGNNDIIVGKVMPYKAHGSSHERDTSQQIKGNDEGYIDMNYIGTNSEAYKFAKIRLRKYRKPVVGDKLASTAAQKGTIGMIYHQQDMPFTKDGIVPDIIMNPHAIPSRMTMGQLMECIMGKAACHIGAYGDATPFSDCSVESIASVLGRSGFERYGNEILYNGRTGEQLKTEIFIGPTYYQRLKHMVQDKSHSRGSAGPIIMLTRQPAEGRARNGGLRFGEMERDAIVAHGASSFLKERMLDVSDNFRVFVCRKCGLLCTANPDKNLYKCNNCKNNADITQVRIPYSMKLLMQELLTMGVAPRMVV